MCFSNQKTNGLICLQNTNVTVRHQPKTTNKLQAVYVFYQMMPSCYNISIYIYHHANVMEVCTGTSKEPGLLWNSDAYSIFKLLLKVTKIKI